MNQKPKRFAILTRVSSSRQEDGESLTVQLKLGQTYIRKLKGKFVEEYRGVESASKSVKEREVLQRVLSDAHSGRWDALWVLDQSRLTRSPDTLIAIVSTFKLMNLELHMQTGRAQLDTPEGELFAGMQSQADRFFAQKMTQRTRQSRLEILQNGRHAFGRWPWGRKWNKEQQIWEIISSQKTLIKRAYCYYVKNGLSLAQVAAKLDMAQSSLTKAFQSAGTTQWARKLATPEGVQTFTLDIPALLTPQENRDIERRKKRNATIRPGTKRSRWMLQGVIRCWYCNGNLSGMPSSKEGNSTHPVYRHLPAKHGPQCPWHVPANLIEHDIVYACSQIIRDSTGLTRAIAAGMSQMGVQRADALAKAKEIDRSLHLKRQRLERATSELLELKRSDTACEPFRKEIAKLSCQIDDLQIEKREVQNIVSFNEGFSRGPKEIAGRLRSLIGLRGAAALSTLSREQKRILVLTMVNRDSRASPNGIYVKMRRHGSRKLVSWQWELRGSIALVEGEISEYDALTSGTNIKPRNNAEPHAIARLSELANSLRPMKRKANSKWRYTSGSLLTSGDSHRYA